MKNRIIKFGKWAEKNWLSLVIVLGVTMMIFLYFVMISWLIGYWANALYGMHFELSSCLAGIGASITGLGGVIGLGKACWTKYGYDSRYNTPAGIMPKVPETAVKTANTVEKVVSKLKG